MRVEFSTDQLVYLYTTPLNQITGKLEFGKHIIRQYKKKINILMAITDITHLRNFRSLNFEFLKGDRKGQCSIRLNTQYRLIFRQTKKDEIEILVVNEISKHYE
ncbi:MAG: type II toxin-antitoxin system RelE/ParE family toxin [Flavobacteriales bacterium]|nr:type II toxin-antitoxin system RelE/ParE family toxin [Flavobacteriales bacterium]